MLEYLSSMKTLPFLRDDKKSRVTVACADGDISVYSHCAYCRYCKGVRMGNRVAPSPQSQALLEVRRGVGSDDVLMNAAMMFNTLVRDGSAIECSDDENNGFASLY
jgi:cytochrome c5